jgi:transposase
LEGILWVLRNDVPWRNLPTTLFGVSGVTCWRRLRDWHTAGVWQALHEQLLAECNAAGRLDLHQALVDSSHIHALKGGAQTGPSPVNRAHPGSKHHVITIIARRGHPTAPAWAPSAGPSSAPSAGATSSAGYAPAGNAAPTSTKHSSALPARSSAYENSKDHSETSS